MLASDRSTVKHALQNIQNDCHHSGFLTALECTKCVFGRDSTPDHAGELTALLQTLTWFKGDLLLKGRWRKGGRRREGREKRKEGEETAPLTQIPGSAPVAKC